MHVPHNSIDVLLFDLGGVLVELTGVPVMLQWLDYSLSEEELWRRWLQSPAVRQFELGRTSVAEFGESVVREFGLPVDADQFIDVFTRWPQGLYPGVLPLLESLQGPFQLACFSNNNQLHWERICHDMGLEVYFKSSFASHLIGRLKPDREAFEYVAASLGGAPDRILFLDDNRLNIEGALSVGMLARRTCGFPEVLTALTALGLVAPADVPTIPSDYVSRAHGKLDSRTHPGTP
jgi:glucose-1-phosphatase